MKNFLIAPSIISANFFDLGKDIKRVISAGADMIHFDVMDNHYVPNITIGPIVLKALIKHGITIPIDVHLMTKPVDNIIIDFASIGVNYISFHLDASENIEHSLNIIKKYGCKAGLAFNPATPLSYLKYIINKLDLILIMAVNPGFSGQTFLETTINKIREARQLINKSNRKIYLEVDGGINTKNIYNIGAAGADILVSGSAIFSQKNYKIIINIMRKQLSKITDC